MTALGTTTSIGDGNTKGILLLDTATATNSPPSGASAGLAINDIRSAFGCIPDVMSLLLFSTAGSGTMTVTCKLWGHTPLSSGQWLPIGTGADTTKGTINAGAAIGETSADKLVHSEVIQVMGHFDRIYLEITAIGGTSTAVIAYLVGRIPNS